MADSTPLLEVMNNSARFAEGTIEDFIRTQALIKRASWVPYYSRAQIVGYANDAQLAFTGTEITFFDASRGNRGTGHARPLTAADTVLASGGNVLSAGIEFLGASLALRVQPEMPTHIKQQLIYEGTLFHSSGNSFRQLLGRGEYFTAGGYGIQAAAASTTVSNSVINQSTNGRADDVVFPHGSQLIFPAKQQINLSLAVNPPEGQLYLTTDNQPLAADGSNALDEIQGYFDVVMWGWQFELIQ